MLLDIVFSVQIVGRDHPALANFMTFVVAMLSIALTVESGFAHSGDVVKERERKDSRVTVPISRGRSDAECRMAGDSEVGVGTFRR
jgi:hypothetical protein